jgi:hypothetical protein
MKTVMLVMVDAFRYEKDRHLPKASAEAIVIV